MRDGGEVRGEHAGGFGTAQRPPAQPRDFGLASSATYYGSSHIVLQLG